MSINKILLAMALGLALTACSNKEQAADSAAEASAAATDAAAASRAATLGSPGGEWQHAGHTQCHGTGPCKGSVAWDARCCSHADASVMR
jgi:hypothetical protein